MVSILNETCAPHPPLTGAPSPQGEGRAESPILHPPVGAITDRPRLRLAFTPKGSLPEGVPRTQKKLLQTEQLFLCVFPYASAGAPTGQTPAQAPQEMQVSASITYLPSPSLMAETGHSSAQEPQATHSSLITYAMISTSMFYLWDHYTTHSPKMQEEIHKNLNHVVKHG